MTDIKTLKNVIRYIIDVREVDCMHLHPAPDFVCAKCVADAALVDKISPDMREAIGLNPLPQGASE